MDMLPTLCTAMKRAGGDALVLRTGESPHVLTPNGRQNVARAILSGNALEALVSQIFSGAGRQALHDTNVVVEQVTVPEVGLTLSARAERAGDQITIELRESAPVPVAAATDIAAVESEPQAVDVASDEAAADSQQWFEVPLSGGSDGAFDAVPSFASTVEPVETLETPVHEIAAREIEPLIDAPASSYEELFLQVPPAANAEEPAPEPEVTAAIEAEATREPEPVAWTFSEQPPVLESPTSDPSLPVYEESSVSASPDLEFVEPSSAADGAPGNQPAGLTAWATLAAARGATALYLRANATPMARVEDRVEPLAADAVDPWRFDELLNEFNGGRSHGWEPGAHGEWSWRVPSIGEVSCWSFNDDHGPGLMMRLRLQAASRSLHKIIPRRVRAACDGDGLVVVAAPTSADLATVAAAVGDIAGRQRGGYVISLRAAGTARHDIAGAFVSQREFNGNDGDAAVAIRAAASESPDVLIVAPPTSEAAMREVVNAAEGGRLVIVAVLAPTSMQALRAIVGRGSAGGDAQTRLALATSFRVAFAYRVLQRLGGGRTPVRDLVVGTSEISALLASGDFTGISRLQREGAISMTTVDDSLARAVRRGHLTLRQAASHAVDKKYLVNLVRTGRRSGVQGEAGAPSGVLEPVSSSRAKWSSH
jgi:Tfp pilus assembly pilus retraction ATPase PilT